MQKPSKSYPLGPSYIGDGVYISECPSRAGLWITAAMWKKSALRELYKVMPRSPALDAAMAADVEALEGRAPDTLDITSQVKIKPRPPAQEEDDEEES